MKSISSALWLKPLERGSNNYYFYNNEGEIKGINFNPSLNFTWEPGNDHLDTGEHHTLHVNSPGQSYWREAEAELEDMYYLNSVDNEFVVIWNYSGYDATPSTKNASLVFKYWVYNDLKTTDGHEEIKERSFPVVVK